MTRGTENDFTHDFEFKSIVFDFTVQPSRAAKIVQNVAQLLGRHNCEIDLAQDDANFLEALRAGTVAPGTIVGREKTLPVLEATRLAGALTCKLYNEATVLDSLGVLSEISFLGISPDRTEQVDAFFTLQTRQDSIVASAYQHVRVLQDSLYESELAIMLGLYCPNGEPTTDINACFDTIGQTLRQY